MNRRRFLTIAAAALTLPAALPGHAAEVAEWHGSGLGTALSLRLAGVTSARMALVAPRVEAEVARVERIASLHIDSELARLNRDGRLAWPSAGLLELLGLADAAWRATGGAFDPTVQPLYLAMATGGDIGAARALVGWERVRVSRAEVRLAPGQALTLNGIAQGWAADRVAALLAGHGFGRALIDMGEIATLGEGADNRPWRAAIAAPDGTPLGEAGLAGRALAVSSPLGTRIGTGLPHILGPRGQESRWQTVAVSAPRAAIADALSTAFCLMGRGAIGDVLARFPGTRTEVLAEA